MNILQIDTSICSQCGICAAVCPIGLIDFRKKDYPEAGAAMESRCFRCGHCVVVCPSGCLIHRDIPAEQCTPIEKKLQITAAQGEQFLKSRRSIRVYRNKAVPRDVIKHIIEIARYAATGGNGQEVEWMVFDNQETLCQIEKLGLDWMRWTAEQEHSTVFNMADMIKLQEKSMKELLRGAPVLVVAHAADSIPIAAVDCVIALTYLELAAKSQGLGSCWAGLVDAMTSSFPPMQELLSLPPGQKAHGSVMLGYPKYHYTRIPLRKPPQIIWHDRFQK
ncbi:nitroreductase family protein [Chloroflexota bacterium]